MVDLETNTELFDTTHYSAGEWMQLEYTGMGASETRTFPSPWVNTSSFQRLGNMSVPLNWSCIEQGPVRTVFSTAKIQTQHSQVQLILEIYSAIKRVDVRVRILAWDNAFGVVNRVVFPMNTQQQNVSYSVPYGVVQVGVDEAEDGFNDMWLLSPPPSMDKFSRAWLIRPREISDWIRVDGVGEGSASTAPGVTLSSSVGAFDWTDITAAYGPSQVVLAPEMMLATNSNRGPFLPEPGDHDFLFSVTATGSGWTQGWKQGGVQPNNPLRSVTVAMAAAATRASSSTSSSTSLPLSHSFLNVTVSPSSDIDADAIWVTAVKKEDGVSNNGLIIRMVGISSMDQMNVNVQTGLMTDITGAYATNLIELDPQEMVVGETGTNFPLNLTHWSIETMRVDVI